VNAYLLGEAGAGALADVLYGITNPSGRLPESFPLQAADVPSSKRFAAGNAKAYYQESIYVGYRYYQTKNMPVLFPFGYGLSYTSFTYSNLKASAEKIKVPGTLKVSVDIKNTGSVFGREVVQLYVENAPGPVFKAVRELKRFTKVGLAPGETKTVQFTVNDLDFSYFDPVQNRFLALPGTYRVAIMKNAAEPLLSAPVTLVHPACPAPAPALIEATSYDLAHGLIMTDEDFELLIGKKLEAVSQKRRRPYTVDDNLGDVSRTLTGKLMAALVKKIAAGAIKNETESYRRMVLRSLLETPLRSIAVMSGGMIGMRFMLGLVDLMNLRPDRALLRLFGRD